MIYDNAISFLWTNYTSYSCMYRLIKIYPRRVTPLIILLPDVESVMDKYRALFLGISKNLRAQKRKAGDAHVTTANRWTSRMPRLIPQLDGLVGMSGVGRYIGACR